jgi:hypothetical protein
MSLWENLLEQQEKRDRQNQAECESQKVWLADKRRELEQVQNQIEAILNQSELLLFQEFELGYCLGFLNSNFFVNVINSLFNGCNCLGSFIGNFNIKFLLERHD